MTEAGEPLIRDLKVPARVLVTGASSGIGLAMIRRLLDSPRTQRVIAVSRHAGQSSALRDLVQQHGDRLHCLEADLTDEAAIGRLAAAARAQVPDLHLVVNAAGILHGDGLAPEKSARQVHMDSLERVFALNAFAPILLAAALLPLLATDAPSVFASLSARVGSIGDNRLGGWYAYRAAKAAQNQLLKTFAIELARGHRRACCLLLHPGTVDTPLSAPFQARVPADKLFTPERAARQLLDVIAGASPADNGRFLAWDGSPIPW